MNGNDFDPLKLLDQSAMLGGGMPDQGLTHDQELGNLDELSLLALGTEKIPNKIASTLNKKGLLEGQHTISNKSPNNTINPIQNYNSDTVNRLEAKISFLEEKLHLCESKLSDDQLQEYKIQWAIKIAEAAGEDMMVAAGKGFQHKNEKLAEPILDETQEQEELDNPDDMSLEDIIGTLGDDEE